MRWDEEASATPNARLAFFAEFLATTRVYDSWLDSCPGNILLIAAQRPNATRVAGTASDVMLEKGEKGIGLGEGFAITRSVTTAEGASLTRKWLSGMEIHKALKEAQIEMHEQVRKSHDGGDLPYYWGCLVLFGR